MCFKMLTEENSPTHITLSRLMHSEAMSAVCLLELFFLKLDTGFSEGHRLTFIHHYPCQQPASGAYPSNDLQPRTASFHVTPELIGLTGENVTLTKWLPFPQMFSSRELFFY